MAIVCSTVTFILGNQISGEVKRKAVTRAKDFGVTLKLEQQSFYPLLHFSLLALVICSRREHGNKSGAVNAVNEIDVVILR